MAKYMGIVVGAAVAVLGIAGLLIWWCDFVTVLKGSIPLMLIFGGIIALIAGLSELKDEQAAKNTSNK